jgi:hypothetical protein
MQIFGRGIISCRGFYRGSTRTSPTFRSSPQSRILCHDTTTTWATEGLPTSLQEHGIGITNRFIYIGLQGCGTPSTRMITLNQTPRPVQREAWRTSQVLTKIQKGVSSMMLKVARGMKASLVRELSRIRRQHTNCSTVGMPLPRGLSLGTRPIRRSYSTGTCPFINETMRTLPCQTHPAPSFRQVSCLLALLRGPMMCNYLSCVVSITDTFYRGVRLQHCPLTPNR